MADLFHIYLSAPGLSADDAELERKLNLAKDWIRYSDHSWLVYTTSDAATWYARLGDFVKARKGHVFIIRVDPSDRQGWMPKSVWKWLHAKDDEMEDH